MWTVLGGKIVDVALQHGEDVVALLIKINGKHKVIRIEHKYECDSHLVSEDITIKEWNKEYNGAM